MLFCYVCRELTNFLNQWFSPYSKDLTVWHIATCWNTPESYYKKPIKSENLWELKSVVQSLNTRSPSYSISISVTCCLSSPRLLMYWRSFLLLARVTCRVFSALSSSASGGRWINDSARLAGGTDLDTTRQQLQPPVVGRVERLNTSE
jgi:hypothetical protein